jgi:hypothetical protein
MKDILAHNLQSARRLFNGAWWFQQDNAPKHTSRLVREWIHNNGVQCIDFPPYSPDLNPIENIWADLKRRIERRHACTVAELEVHLGVEWEATNPIFLATLAHSMPARCQAVGANNGHKAPYKCAIIIVVSLLVRETQQTQAIFAEGSDLCGT